jgi:hypothetical protein
MKVIKDEIVFLYTEVKKTLSNEPSYFSSKRIERALLFITALTSANYWFWTHVTNLAYSEVIAFSATLLGFAGYTMATTQKEKRLNKENKSKEDE